MTLNVMPMAMPASAPGSRPDAAAVDCVELGPEEALEVVVAAISVLFGFSGGERQQKKTWEEG